MIDGIIMAHSTSHLTELLPLEGACFSPSQVLSRLAGMYKHTHNMSTERQTAERGDALNQPGNMDNMHYCKNGFKSRASRDDHWDRLQNARSIYLGLQLFVFKCTLKLDLVFSLHVSKERNRDDKNVLTLTLISDS